MCYYDTEEVTTSAKVETSDDTEEATARPTRKKTKRVKREVDEPEALHRGNEPIANASRPRKRRAAARA